MSGAVLKIGSNVLKSAFEELGKKTGMAALDALTGDLFDLDKKKDEELKKKISEVKEDTEEIKKNIEALNGRIDEVVNKLNDIGTKIKEFSNSVDDDFFGVKIDAVSKAVDAINSKHEMYIGAILAMAPGVEDKEKSPGSNRLRVTQLGVQIASSDGVYLNLKEIHTALVDGDSCLLAKCRTKALRDCKDVLTYYARLRAFFMNYVAVQLRGICLLTCAQKDPEVPFSDAQHDLDIITANLDIQYKRFRTLMGPRTESFARRVLERPGELITVTFKAAEGDLYLDPRRKEDEEGTRREDNAFLIDNWGWRHFNGYVVTVSQARFWSIRLNQGDLKEIALDGDYTFNIQTNQKPSNCSLVSGRWCVGEIVPAGMFPVDSVDGLRDYRFFPLSDDDLIISDPGNKFRMEMKDIGTLNWYKRPTDLENLTGSQNRMLFGSDEGNLESNGPNKFYVSAAEDYGIGNTLYQGSDTLPAGIYMVSTNRRYSFGLNKTTGAVELLDTESSEHRILWTESHGVPDSEPATEGGWLVLQDDGNLCAYNKNSKVFFSSDTASSNKRSVLLDDTGKLRLLDENGNDLKSWP